MRTISWVIQGSDITLSNGTKITVYISLLVNYKIMQLKTYLSVKKFFLKSMIIILRAYSLFCSVSPSQLACLRALRLPHLYSSMELFVNWVKDGMYELPFVMKKHLEPMDEEVLDMLDTSYEGV